MLSLTIRPAVPSATFLINSRLFFMVILLKLFDFNVSEGYFVAMFLKEDMTFFYHAECRRGLAEFAECNSICIFFTAACEFEDFYTIEPVFYFFIFCDDTNCVPCAGCIYFFL